MHDLTPPPFTKPVFETRLYDKWPLPPLPTGITLVSLGEMCRGGRFLKLKDLRISKLNKRVRTQPCSQELENYLSYLSNAYGESDKIPKSIGLELSNCMEQVGKVTKPASLAFHIAKFVQR